MLKQLALLWCLLTRIPLPRMLHSKDILPFSKSLSLLPIAGLLLGVLNVLISHVLLLTFPPLPSAWIATFLYILLGWGLHLDGWGDLFDGIGSGKDHDEFLKIMKDSHSGAFGAMALICIIGIRATLLGSLPIEIWTSALLLSASVGRLAICSSAYVGEYPWANGMAREAVQGFQISDLKRSVFISLLLFPLGVKHLILSVLLSLIIGYSVGYWANKKIGGVNGDVLGACAVLGEVTVIGIYFL